MHLAAPDATADVDADADRWMHCIAAGLLFLQSSCFSFCFDSFFVVLSYKIKLQQQQQQKGIQKAKIKAKQKRNRVEKIFKNKTKTSSSTARQSGASEK